MPERQDAGVADYVDEMLQDSDDFSDYSDNPYDDDYDGSEYYDNLTAQEHDETDDEQSEIQPSDEEQNPNGTVTNTVQGQTSGPPTAEKFLKYWKKLRGHRNVEIKSACRVINGIARKVMAPGTLGLSLVMPDPVGFLQSGVRPLAEGYALFLAKIVMKACSPIIATIARLDPQAFSPKKSGSLNPFRKKSA